MKKIIGLIAVAIISLTAINPAWAGPVHWNDEGVFGAYVDYVFPRDHDLAAWEIGTKTVFFYSKQCDDRYRGSWFPFGYYLEGLCFGVGLEIIGWLDDDTILVSAFCDDEYSDFSGKAMYEVSTDGAVVFTGFENMDARSRRQVLSLYLESGFSEEWDFRDDSKAIVQFRDDLCTGKIPINDTSVAIEVLENPVSEYYDTIEAFLGCNDPIITIIPLDDRHFEIKTVWHSYIFGKKDNGEFMIVSFSAPEDL
ncbi:MAG TPA: hypothetical protein ENN67_06750 [Firmicutes bacterium]|nr:hypothetical protein [Bacillota bacterium]